MKNAERAKAVRPPETYDRILTITVCPTNLQRYCNDVQKRHRNKI